MIKYKNFKQFKDYHLIQELWNDDLLGMYPVSDFIFKQNVSENKYVIKENSYVALVGDEVVGFIIAKEFMNDMVKRYHEIGFISLFYVKRKYRRQKIATTLFEKVEAGFKKMGKKTIWIGKDINNFFPGVPVDFNHLTTVFLEKIGYNNLGPTHDMVCYHYQKDVIEHFENMEKYEYRYFEEKDYKATKAFFEKCFPGRWEFEFQDYYETGIFGKDYIICLDKDQVVGFVRLSDTKVPIFPYHITWYQKFNNLGALGPLGVDSDHRRQKIGSNLLKIAIKDLHERGCTELLIDWTGLLDVYNRLGFEVWKSYTNYEKKV